MAFGLNFRRPSRRSLVIAGLVAIAALASAIVISREIALASPEQPLPFSHRRHTQAGIQCLYCHVSPMRSDVAGLPSVEKCMGCHRTIAVDRPAIVALSGYWEGEEPIPWRPVTERSDLVYFSHQAHLLNAVTCEACHGPVGAMEQTRPVENMDMGFCLACHLEQAPDKIARLEDCLACHK